jgi:hypothetical protein
VTFRRCAERKKKSALYSRFQQLKLTGDSRRTDARLLQSAECRLRPAVTDEVGPQMRNVMRTLSNLLLHHDSMTVAIADHTASIENPVSGHLGHRTLDPIAKIALVSAVNDRDAAAAGHDGLHLPVDAAPLQIAGQAAASPLSTSIDLATLTPPHGFTIYGAAAGDHLGHSVSSAGDVNGDGYDDLIIGAPCRQPDREC